jgi:outer membrane protein assembly factor BamB
MARNATQRARAVIRRRAPRAATLLCLLAFVLAESTSAPALGEPAWPTYHHDAARSGLDPEAGEAVTPTQAWQSSALGAPIWGQPVVLGSRVYVATVGNRIYALDAASGAIVWQKSAGTAVPSGKLPCGDIFPTVGIVGTPVIDTGTGAVYAVADTWNATTEKAHHVLKGYDLASGKVVLSKRVDPPGLQPETLLQRTALNLDGSEVVFGFGGNDGDCGNYRGTVVAAPVGGGAAHFWTYQPAPPAFSGGGVWGPSGPAVDGEGHIYASTGNPNPSGGEAITYDYSDSVLQLSSEAVQLGSFKPPTWQYDSNHDVDLASAGPELLPGGTIFQAGKNGIGYLISESSMSSAAPALYEAQVCGGSRSFGGDAYAAGVIYIPCANGTQALAYNQSAHTFSSLWKGPSDANGPPILTAGLVWSVATAGGGGTKLYGLEPASGKARYTLTLPSPVADHFASPSAAGGQLFLATGSTVTAYRVARTSAEAPSVTAVSPTKGPVSGGTTVTVTGTSLTGATAVRFGSVSAKSFTVTSPTSITAVSPPESAGVVDITVTTPSGTSATSSKDHFKFTPTVTKLSPTSGSVSGGTSVTITGTGFALGTTATIIHFGTAKASTVNCTSKTSCTVTAPSHEAGTVHVKATVNKVSSPINSPGDQFKYA